MSAALHYLTAGAQNFALRWLQCVPIALIIALIMRKPTLGSLYAAAAAAALLCTATVLAAVRSQPETFIIHEVPSGHEATIKVPVGAVSAFSADNAEALADYTNSDVEAMRLSGDVRIDVVATGEPIRIKADRVVLELTADEAAGGKPEPRGVRRMRSSHVIDGGAATKTFVGDVVFTLQTSSGAMQIKADRVEHTDPVAGRSEPREGA